MRRARPFVIFCAGLFCLGCSTHAARGTINGIEYHTSLDRATVEGGTSRSLKVTMHDAEQGFLVVDGVPFGVVHVGDRVVVTENAAVLVNGAARQRTARLGAE